MIEAVLFFVLGFASAAFLCLLAAPAVVERTARLTRRRLEAALPVRREEISAHRDGLRAEFAVIVRRLEMELASLREARAGQAVAAAGQAQEMAELGEERERLAGEVETLLARCEDLDGRLAQAGERLESLSRELEETAGQLVERDAELVRVSHLYEQASLLSSTRQVELATRESDIDRLSQRVKAALQKRKEAEARARDAAAENKTLRKELQAEKRRSAGVENKLEKMIATMSDEEDRLERQDRTLQRLRERLARLEEGEATGGTGDEALRASIGELAAEMVHLTALLEGENSPLDAILSSAGSADGPRPGLAERVHALRAAARALPAPPEPVQGDR